MKNFSHSDDVSFQYFVEDVWWCAPLNVPMSEPFQLWAKCFKLD